MAKKGTATPSEGKSALKAKGLQKQRLSLDEKFTGKPEEIKVQEDDGINAAFKKVQAAGFDNNLFVIFNEEEDGDTRPISEKLEEANNLATEQLNKIVALLSLALPQSASRAEILKAVKTYGALREGLGRRADEFKSSLANKLGAGDNTKASTEARQANKLKRRELYGRFVIEQNLLSVTAWKIAEGYRDAMNNFAFLHGGIKAVSQKIINQDLDAILPALKVQFQQI